VYAIEHGIPVIQTEKLSTESVARILAYNADVGVVVGFGNLIPQSLIDGFPKGIVNIHPSLLPAHRGATPTAGAIMNGDKTTGVSLMQIDNKLDHGPVIAQRTFELEGDETSDGLLEALTPLAQDLLVAEFPRYVSGEIEPTAQDDSQATTSSEFSDNDARIDWTHELVSIERNVRALHGHIPAWSMLGDKKFIIYRAHPLPGEHDLPPGTFTERDSDLQIVCVGGYLVCDEVQLAGGKQMSGQAFRNGHRDLIGSQLR
jgi:methionyl-tRNA formyltransferase